MKIATLIIPAAVKDALVKATALAQHPAVRAAKSLATTVPSK